VTIRPATTENNNTIVPEQEQMDHVYGQSMDVIKPHLARVMQKVAVLSCSSSHSNWNSYKQWYSDVPEALNNFVIIQDQGYSQVKNCMVDTIKLIEYKDNSGVIGVYLLSEERLVTRYEMLILHALKNKTLSPITLMTDEELQATAEMASEGLVYLDNINIPRLTISHIRSKTQSGYDYCHADNGKNQIVQGIDKIRVLILTTWSIAHEKEHQRTHYHTCESCGLFFKHSHSLKHAAEDAAYHHVCVMCDKLNKDNVVDHKIGEEVIQFKDDRYQTAMQLETLQVQKAMAWVESHFGRSLSVMLSEIINILEQRLENVGYHRIYYNYQGVDNTDTKYYPIMVHQVNGLRFYRSDNGYVVYKKKGVTSFKKTVQQFVKNHPYIAVKWLDLNVTVKQCADEKILLDIRKDIQLLRSVDVYQKLVYIVGNPSTKAIYYEALNFLRLSHYMRTRERSNPRGYLFAGGSGLGKTYDITKIVSDQGILQSNVYDVSYNPKTNVFYDGYVGQPIVRFDDLGHYKSDEWLQLIRVINDAPYNLPMVMPNSKDSIPLLAEEVYITSNHLDKLLALDQSSRDAICRRLELFEYQADGTVLHKLYNLAESKYLLYQVLTREQLLAYFSEEVANKRQLPSCVVGESWVWKHVSSFLDVIAKFTRINIKELVMKATSNILEGLKFNSKQKHHNVLRVESKQHLNIKRISEDMHVSPSEVKLIDLSRCTEESTIKHEIVEMIPQCRTLVEKDYKMRGNALLKMVQIYKHDQIRLIELNKRFKMLKTEYMIVCSKICPNCQNVYSECTCL
jgi:hypothetical protein